MNLEEAVLKLDDKEVRQCFDEEPQWLEKIEVRMTKAEQNI